MTTTMRRSRPWLGPILALVLVGAIAGCAPQVPAGVDAIDLGAAGRWSTPDFTITAKDDLNLGGLAASPKATRFTVTASHGGVEVASFVMNGASIFSQGIDGQVTVGQFVAPDFQQTARSFVVNDVNVPGGYGLLAGVLTVTEIEFGATYFEGIGHQVRPVTHLRATVTLFMPEPLGVVTGTLALG